MNRETPKIEKQKSIGILKI